MTGIRVLELYLKPRAAMVALLGMLLLAATGLAVVAPQVLSRFIDAVGVGAELTPLLWFAGAYVGVAGLAESLWLVADATSARIAWSATNELRLDLLEHCLGLDLPFVERRSSGELIDRIDGDVGRLARFFSQMVLLVVANALLLAGIGVALFIEDWRIGLCYVPFVVVSAALLRRLMGTAVPAVVAQRDRNARLLGFLDERFGGLEDLRTSGAYPEVRHGFWLRATRLLTASRHAARLGVRWPAAAHILGATGLLLALTAAVLLVRSGDLTLGSAYVLLAYAGMLQVPLMVIVSQARELEEAVGSLRRIGELFGESSALTSGERRLPPRHPGAPPAVALEHVSFSYGGGFPVVRDVSVELAPGGRLALVGRTGGGKSTIVKLLARLVDPSGGRVLLGGHDVRDLSSDSLRAHVGLVTQEVHVFTASIRDNVTMFDDTVPDDRVVAAVRDVGLGAWLDGCADGVQTVLSEGAKGMSAGEAQLLAFARVLVTDPGLVVLDEASSRLGAADRVTFDAAVRRVLSGRTAVIVAHDPEALRHADEVVVLQDGRVLERGEPAVLAADPSSAYATLMRTGEAFA